MATYQDYQKMLQDYYAAQGPAPTEPYYDPQAEVSGYGQAAGYADALKAYQNYTTKTGQGWLDSLSPAQLAEYNAYHQQAVDANAKKARNGAFIALGAPLMAAGVGAALGPAGFGSLGTAGEAAADPGALPASWDETDATKDAGEQDLAETPDQIVDQLRMGDINVIYKERSIYGMQYIGDPYIFRFYRLPGDMGLLARGCVVNTPMGHVVLSPGDVILHSGQGPRSIINGKMRRWLFNSIDSTYYARSFLVASYPTNEVWICFPESGQTACTMALVWNWNDDTLGVRQLLNATYGASGQVISSSSGTWAADTDTWAVDSTAWGNDGFAAAEERLILCESTPMLSIIETGASWNGTSKTCFVERSGLHFDAPDKVKTCSGIIPRIDASPGTVLSVEIGASMDAEVAPTWQLPVTYTVGTSRKVDAFATGRYLAYRITSTGTDAWRLNSVDFDIVSRGNY